MSKPNTHRSSFFLILSATTAILLLLFACNPPAHAEGEPSDSTGICPPSYPGWNYSDTRLGTDGKPECIYNSTSDNPTNYGWRPKWFAESHQGSVGSQAYGVSPYGQTQGPSSAHGCWHSYVASRTRNAVVGMATSECW